MGGGMRSGPPTSRSAGPSRMGGPNINVGVGGPVIAPPMFGSPFMRPSIGFFPPILPLPVPSFGPSYSDQMIQDQQRRDERAMDGQQGKIEALQKEIAELKAKRQ